MEKLYTLRDACEISQLDPTTIRKWDREGKIKCIRLSNNFRRVPESEINRILGIKNNRMSFIYARVSSHDQKADLDRLASLAITHRGIDLCGDPFPVSASASWQSMKDEYLYIRDKPEIPEAGSTEAAYAANRTGA